MAIPSGQPGFKTTKLACPDGKYPFGGHEENPSMRNVIVVVGSVKSREYGPVRANYTRRGEKVTIKRIKSAWWDDLTPEQMFGSSEAAIADFFEPFNIRVNEVVEVVCSNDYIDKDEAELHVFSTDLVFSIPRLRSVWYVLEDGSLREVVVKLD